MTDLEDERERCALLAEELAAIHVRSARRMRDHGQTRMFWVGPRYVIPAIERDAKFLDTAAHSLRTVAHGIREGWDVRTLADSALFDGPGPRYGT